VQQLEETVRDQAQKIAELSNLISLQQVNAAGPLRLPNLSPLPDMPPSVSLSGRSVSQAFWESRPDAATLISSLNPGVLQRETSSSSFFEMPKF